MIAAVREAETAPQRRRKGTTWKRRFNINHADTYDRLGRAIDIVEKSEPGRMLILGRSFAPKRAKGGFFIPEALAVLAPELDAAFVQVGDFIRRHDERFLGGAARLGLYRPEQGQGLVAALVVWAPSPASFRRRASNPYGLAYNCLTNEWQTIPPHQRGAEVA